MSINARVKHKRDTASNWTSKDPVLLDGEIIVVDDSGTMRLKMGDGSTAYSKLPFYDAPATAHIANTSNPHNVTKAQVGLGNVDNTSDTAKPVSTAQQVAIEDAKKAGTDAQADIDSHTANTSNPHGVTKAQVGLGNVDNTADADKSVKYAATAGDADTVGGFTVGVNVPASAKFTDTTYSAMTASEATTGTATTARSITAKVLNDKIKEVVDANAYSLPTASSSTLGGVKTTSTVTSTSGLTACPIISGVPYYKDTDTTYALSSFGVTATAAELNLLDGVTATTTELNYVDGVTSNIQTQLNAKAPLASPALTGTPTAPTATAGTNTTQVATTAFVTTAVANKTSVSGNAGTATKLATARNIALTGDVTGSASFDGSAAASIAATLANSGATAGSYGPSANASPAHSGTFSVPYVTVDAKGRVTAISTKTITLPAAASASIPLKSYT